MSDEPAKSPDWEMAKLLYVQGAKRSAICAKSGCTNKALDRRITRGKWRDLRERFNEQAPPQTMTVAQRGALVQQLIATEAHSQLHNLTTIPNGKNVDAAYVKASTLDKLSGVAATVFGGMGQPRMLFTLESMDAAVLTARPYDSERDKHLTKVRHLGNGFTQLTFPDGRIEILDKRHEMPHPELYENCKPPPPFIEVQSTPMAAENAQRLDEPLSNGENNNENE